jgi:nucleotide-binding universal stress UspA family protein
MKKIIIATDFSEAALNAAKYGKDMAAAINADLLLLHVYEVPVVYSNLPVVVTEQEVLENAELKMDILKEVLEETNSSIVNIETDVRPGEFFEELNKVCTVIDPYTVVLGSQGKTAANRFMFGSQSVHTMKFLNWPVITVPPNSAFHIVKKIGLACDFEKVEATVPVDEVKNLVHDFGAELYVLHTGAKMSYDADMVFEKGLLQEMINDLKPKFHFLGEGNSDEAILKFVDDNHLDLLLILPKRHSLVEKIFHKSHTKQFVLHSHVPVMALHA